MARQALYTNALVDVTGRRHYKAFSGDDSDVMTAVRVECPACGKRVTRKSTFTCKKCGRPHLCLAHYGDYGLCKVCATGREVPVSSPRPSRSSASATAERARQRPAKPIPAPKPKAKSQPPAPTPEPRGRRQPAKPGPAPPRPELRTQPAAPIPAPEPQAKREPAKPAPVPRSAAQKADRSAIQDLTPELIVPGISAARRTAHRLARNGVPKAKTASPAPPVPPRPEPEKPEPAPEPKNEDANTILKGVDDSPYAHLPVREIDFTKKDGTNGTPAPAAPEPIVVILPPAGRPSPAVLRPAEDMVLIPGGEFVMGSDEIDDNPRRTVSVDLFCIDIAPVTNAQFERFLKESGYQPEDRFGFLADWPNGSCAPEKSVHPVTFVSWQDAMAYAEWAGKDLPTEEEWEKAARGADGPCYPWGNTFESGHANTREASLGRTAPVKQFRQDRSPYGCYDMAGNVMEWTSSWYDETEHWRVLRGGCWNRKNELALLTARHYFKPEARYNRVGFRCVLRRKS